MQATDFGGALAEPDESESPAEPANPEREPDRPDPPQPSQPGEPSTPSIPITTEPDPPGHDDTDIVLRSKGAPHLTSEPDAPVFATVSFRASSERISEGLQVIRRVAGYWGLEVVNDIPGVTDAQAKGEYQPGRHIRGNGLNGRAE